MFFPIFFLFGSSDSSTSSDTRSEASHFWVGFLDGAGLQGVLVGVLVGVLRAEFFFVSGLSTLSFGKGKTEAGPELHVLGCDTSGVRGILNKVVVFR